jgi:nitrate reductase NapAB chaperone NapD
MTQSMYLVIVGIPQVAAVQLMFNNETRARQVFKVLCAVDRDENFCEVEVSDDYGQMILVNRDETPLICFQNLSRMQEGQIEISLANTRAEAKRQHQAQNDPGLKFLAANAAGLPRFG